MRISCYKNLMLTLVVAASFIGSPPTLADPHPGQSVNVVIIGGQDLNCVSTSANAIRNGGCFPVTGVIGELGDFNFAPMRYQNITPENLAPYDTALLNVASYSPTYGGLACNVDNLSIAQKADLIAFVQDGKKLIIYDSECSAQDYSWLPYPFTTANPGALGARGTLTVVENNLLSTWVGDPACTAAGAADPHCIDVAYLGSSTDAVGDMNVMTTYDPNWCLDMSGTNARNVTGPVHAYAKYPAGTDKGLILYNGLDQDYVNNSQLRQIWVQELQQPFNPSNLPCGVPVVGISLTPATAQNEVGTDHTVTAKLTDLLNEPQPDIQVIFSVTSGPNTGVTGTCSANADCTTDTSGNVSFTYTGAGGVGTDQIVGCFTNQGGQQICSQPVAKEWIITNKPPVCTTATPSVSLLWSPDHTFVPITILDVTDPDGDAVTIKVTSIYQDEAVNAKGSGNTAPDGQGVGTSMAQVRAERVGDPKVLGNGRVYHIRFTADDDRGASCTGEVLVGVPHDQGDGATPVDDGAIYDSTVIPSS